MRAVTALAFAVVVSLGAWAGVAGPAADFPSFVPFASFSLDKTGDVAVDTIGNVYVNVTRGGHVELWQFTPAGEGPLVVADIGTGVAYGLAVTPDGDLYAAIGGPARGVYRVSRNGDVVRVPGTEQIVWANSLAFDHRGNLYVTESYSMDTPSVYGQGGIWRIVPGGEAELWLRSDLLTGTGAVQGFPIGANGIAYDHGDLFVLNTDKGLVVRIAVREDGAPGEPEVWVTLHEVAESPLAGSRLPVAGDGLALDVHGNVYVTVVTRLAVVRIRPDDFVQQTLASFSFNPAAPLFAPLDTPNSLAFGTGKGERQNLFVTNLGLMAGLVPGPSWPGRALLKIPADVPGLPLR